MSGESGQALVIGGGIVGVCCAYALVRRGFAVTLLEKDEPGRAASFGNSASIGLASVPPLGMPGMLRSAPRMLLDPQHALVVRWRGLHRSLPWLLRFARTLDPTRVEAIAGARAALLSHAAGAYEDLLAEIGRPELIYANGQIAAYGSDASFAAAQPALAMRRRHGVAMHEMAGAALRELEPALSERAVRGVYFPSVRTVTEPITLTRAILEAFLAAGGTVRRTAVLGFERSAQGTVERVVTDQGALPCGVVVLAAGAWSARLARELGDKVSVMAERGYHVMLPKPDPAPRLSLLAGDENVSISTLDSGLRMTTMAEFTDIEAPPDHERALRVFRRAAGLLRGVSMDVQSRWMGSRPSTPDSLPVIGRSPSAGNVIYAFGHGHLGLTFGAVTSALVAQLARGETPNFDIAPYRPGRAFDGSHLAPAAALS